MTNGRNTRRINRAFAARSAANFPRGRARDPHGVTLTLGLAGRNFGKARVPDFVLRSSDTCRADPVDRLPNKGSAPVDTPLHLRRELFETFGSDRASFSLRSRGQYWRHGQMEARMKRHGLTHEPEIAIELFELATHRRKLARQGRGIALVIVRTQQLIEGFFDKRRFGSPRTHGRIIQPRGHAVGEIDTNSRLHEGPRSREIRRLDARCCNCKTA